MDIPDRLQDMFLEHFVAAKEHLQSLGLQADVVMGTRPVRQRLVRVDQKIDLPMPKELRDFYLELGNGFRFVPDTNPNSELVAWEAMHLAQHTICNQGFGQQLEEDAMVEVNSARPRADPDLLRKEISLRKKWMPFYGFVGGGSYLCLDLSEPVPAVRFHETLYWYAIPQTWSFILAPSFTEFVEKWSRYHFLSPSGEWTSFCSGRSGVFDWAPEHFPCVEKRQ